MHRTAHEMTNHEPLPILGASVTFCKLCISMVTVEQKIIQRPPITTVKVTPRSHNKVPEYCLLSEEQNPVGQNRQQILVCVPPSNTHKQTAGSAEALPSPTLLTATGSFSMPVCTMNHNTAYISLLEPSSSEVASLTISYYFKSVTVKWFTTAPSIYVKHVDTWVYRVRPALNLN